VGTRAVVGLVASVLMLAGGMVAPGSATVVRQVGDPACVETPRPAYESPELVAQRSSFGYHDEELVICSAGYRSPVHLAARLWVPSACPGVGRCAGVLDVHGFGVTKETNVGDMMNLARRGFYVLTYDVRGQGMSGGQAGIFNRDEIADEAAVLRWFHAYVRPTKVAVYGISQGGTHALMAAIFNCGSERAKHFDSTISCDAGKRWVDAIIPMQPPTTGAPDGTCSYFHVQIAVESRLHPMYTDAAARCALWNLGIAGSDTDPHGGVLSNYTDVFDYPRRLGRIDVPTYLVTGFFDRTVPPQNTTRIYEFLRARRDYHRDVRLTISNDAHGAVGGNFAVLDDAFAWLQSQIQGKKPVRVARVTIAQSWDGNRFRLERDWPIPGTRVRIYALSRTVDEPEANGRLLPLARPRGAEGVDELVPVMPFLSGLDVPYGDTLPPLQIAQGIRDTQLVYATDPVITTVETAGLPSVTFWLASPNAGGRGRGQLHVSLAELKADGSLTEFARSRRGVTGLGQRPRKLVMDLSVSSHRLAPGSRLLLRIAPSDVGVIEPTAATDPVRVIHDAAHPSSLAIPVVDPNRPGVAGPVPSGSEFPGDTVGAICTAFNIKCA
jgi:predicted acyl esterase